MVESISVRGKQQSLLTALSEQQKQCEQQQYNTTRSTSGPHSSGEQQSVVVVGGGSNNNDDDDDDDNNNVVLPFFLTPAHVLAVSSLPLCLGTYIGFKRQLKVVQQEAAQHATAAASAAVSEGGGGKAQTEETLIAITKESKSVARRALGLGTLLSMGGFGLIGAVAFYATGFQSMDEAFQYMHAWGPRKRSQLEKWMGIDIWKQKRRNNDDHPDVRATQHMSADEELEYYRTTYFSATTDDDDDDESQR